MLFQFPTPLLNIKPAFSLPAVEILNSTTPWQLNVHDSEDAVVAVVEDRNKKNDDDDMSRRRQKRGLSSYLLASCGETYRYVVFKKKIFVASQGRCITLRIEYKRIIYFA